MSGLGLFVGLPILVFLLMQTVFFQTFIFNKVAHYISSDMKGEIQVEEVFFSPLTGLSIKNLYVEDLNTDTLLFVEYLVLDQFNLKLVESKIDFNSLKIKNAYFNLYSVNEKEQTNLQFIIDHFTSAEPKDTSAGPFALNVKQIDISDLRFDYKRLQPDSVSFGVNFDDIHIPKFNLLAHDFQMLDDSMNVDIETLYIDEKSGFELQNLAGHAIISSSEISVENLVLKTLNSHIFAHKYSMNYGQWKDMGDFNNKVKLNLDLQLSSVNFLDISYFSSVFKDLDLPTFAKGKVYGKINNLKSKDFSVSVGDRSFIDTRFSIRGLPDIDETFISLDIKDLLVNVEDVEAVLKMQKDSLSIQLPKLVKTLDELKYKGNITGFLTDLVAYGSFVNQYGRLNSDVRFKYNAKHKNFLYSGEIETQALDLSLFNLKDSLLGELSMSGQVLVLVDSLQRVEGQFDGQLQSIGVNRYDYKNIDLNANFKDMKLHSDLVMNDTNAYLNIHSDVDFSLEEPYFDFEADVENVYLSRLNWLDRDQSSQMSFSADAHFSSLKIDQFFGEFMIRNFQYAEKDEEIKAEAINLQSVKNEKSRKIEVYSDLFNLKLEGDFQIKDLMDHSDALLTSYLPSLFNKEASVLNTNIQQDLNFELLLKNTYSVFKIFSPELLIANRTECKGQYNSTEENVQVTLLSDSLRVNGVYVENVNLVLDGDLKEVFVEVNSDYVAMSKDLFFNDVNVNNKLRSDTLNFYLNWHQANIENSEAAEIMTEFVFNPSNFDSLSLDINMIPSYLYIEDSIWFINDAKIKLRGDHTSICDLVMNHDAQYLFADGIWQKEKEDTLHILLNQLDLSYFPILEEKTSLEMRGLVDGDVLLSYHEQQPIATGFLSIDTMKINDQLLGNTKLKIDWEPETSRLLLELDNKIGRKQFKTVSSKGYIDIKHSTMNLDVKLNEQKLVFFEPFIKLYLTDIDGYVSGDLNISGPLEKLEYEADFDFTRAALTYGYLGTRYNFSDKVHVSKDRFVFDNMKFFQFDGRGDYAVANGYIQHDNFKDFQFFINIDTKNFMVLNTSEKDNDLYYGTAFVTGLTQITGTHKNLKIDISATTNKDTRFFIPLSDAEEASSGGFINFVSEHVNKTVIVKDNYDLDLSGIVLDFNLSVTPDAEVQLIIDDKLGDVVKAKGNGDINLKINTIGNFLMSGSYVIEKGEYLFSWENIINKKFIIEPGSDIKWNGDPYQAYVDIDAVYRLKTPIYDLTLNPEDNERIPVECHLNMEKLLMSPEITFDINVPSSGERAKALINAMDQDEKNKQLLSLLVLNKFYTPDYLVGGEEVTSGNAVGKNASELLSSQLSNWFSQVSDDFDIGINYRPGDDISNEEFELALSTQLFNDRVAIDGNLGFGKYENSNSNVVGNVNVDIKINKKGTVRIRGFNRVNENEIENSSLYTQGVGLFYREDFDSFGELLAKYWKKATFQTSKDTVR